MENDYSIMVDKTLCIDGGHKMILLCPNSYILASSDVIRSDFFGYCLLMYILHMSIDDNVMVMVVVVMILAVIIDSDNFGV